MQNLTALRGDGVAYAIGATNPRGYNTILLASWIPKQDGTTHADGATAVFDTPERFFDIHCSTFGSTPDEIRSNLIKAYCDYSAKVLVSALGGNGHPVITGISKREGS